MLVQIIYFCTYFVCSKISLATFYLHVLILDLHFVQTRILKKVFDYRYNLCTYKFRRTLVYLYNCWTYTMNVNKLYSQYIHKLCICAIDIQYVQNMYIICTYIIFVYEHCTCRVHWETH